MKFPVGLRVDGEVNNITDLGIFLDLPHHHHGLIHHKDFGNNWASRKNQIKVGDKFRVVVINNYHGRIALSLSRVNDEDLIDPTNHFNNKKDFKKELTDLLDESAKKIKQFKDIK